MKVEDSSHMRKCKALVLAFVLVLSYIGTSKLFS